MAIQVDDILRITANMDFLGNAIKNIYHYKVEVAQNSSDQDWMDDIAVILDDAYTFVGGDLSINLDFVNISGQNLTQDEVLPTTAWPVLVSGTGASNGTPPQACALAFWNTITPRVVARKFVGVLSELQQDNGNLVAGTIAAMLNYALDIEASSFPLMLDRDAIPGVWNVPLLRFTQLGQSNVNGVMMTQRRRTLGRGV